MSIRDAAEEDDEASYVLLGHSRQAVSEFITGE